MCIYLCTQINTSTIQDEAVHPPLLDILHNKTQFDKEEEAVNEEDEGSDVLFVSFSINTKQRT